MLNYAGIPMPSAVPGASAPLPNRVMPTPSPLSAVHTGGLGPLPPQLSAAIKGPPAPTPGNNPVVNTAPSPDPQDHQFETIAQSDGTLLLKLKGGPILKIITGVKIPGAE